MATSRASSPAARTSRLKPSLSMAPRTSPTNASMTSAEWRSSTTPLRSPDADVVEVHPLVADTERVRLLVEGDEPEVVEQREQLRQRHRRAASVHAHPPLAGVGVEVVAEGDHDVAVAGQHLVDAAEVGDRPFRRDGGAVGRRSGSPGDVEQAMPVALAQFADQRRPEAFGPRDRLLVDGSFEGVEVGVAVRSTDGAR